MLEKLKDIETHYEEIEGQMMDPAVYGDLDSDAVQP